MGSRCSTLLTKRKVTELNRSMPSSMNIFDTSLPHDTVAPSDDSSDSTMTSELRTTYYKIFTLNFTITNLLYKANMGERDSSTFKATENVLQQLLKELFERSSLGSQYAGCSVTLLRSLKKRRATGVNALCTFKETSSKPELEKEKVYWELTEQLFRRKLRNLVIDKDSLIVDGYNRQMTLFKSRKAGLIKPNIHKDMKQEMERAGDPNSQVSVSRTPYYKIFTLNFTIINMLYEAKMSEKDSSTFKATENVLQQLLKLVFGMTTLGSQYAGCSVTLLRPLKNGTATGVKVLCTCQGDSSKPLLNKEKVYWELTEYIYGRNLKHLLVERDSLFVDGYNHKLPCIRSTKRSKVDVGPVTNIPDQEAPGDMASVTSGMLTCKSTVDDTTGSSNLKTFTINFTITNMLYTAKMDQRDSTTFRIAELILQHLLKVLFERSSLGSHYSGCTSLSLRSMKNGTATGVDAICSYQEVSSSPVLDRKKIYWELSQQTDGITKLGGYILDKKSLYVDGYNHQMPSTSTNSSSAESKGKIMTTAGEPETIMTTTSSPAVRTHSVLATTASTTASDIDLEKITVPASSALPETMVAPAAWSGVATSPSETTLIAEISTPPGAGTGGGSPIGVPSHPATPDTTASTTAFPWTDVLPAGSTSTSATSLSSVSREDPKPMTSLDTSASETTVMATAREGPALTESTATMDISRGAEAVVLSTSDLPTSSAAPLIPTDKVSTQTTMITIADTAPSLTPSPSSSTAASERPRRERFTMNFTINNMLYTEDMEQPYSEKFSSTERILQHLLRGLFKNSSLASSYTGCTLTSLRPMKEGEATGVDVVCAHYKGFTSPVLDPVKVYWELSNQTYGITRLGPYTLDRDSLFLNGYNDKEISSIRSSSAESKGKIMTTAGEPETIMTTTSSPAVRTHSVLATTASTTASDIDLEKITVPASSALPETMVAPAAWSGVEMSPSETTLIAEISTPPGAGTGGGSPIGVPSHPATPDTTASTTAFRWTNVPPAGSTSTSATSLSSVSREDPKPMTSLDTVISETTAMATAREGPALTESTAMMDISRGAEAVVLSTSDLPTSSAAPLIPTDKVSTQTTMTTIADTAPSLTPSPSSSTAASGRPRRERFTMNFTINNMLYTEDMEHPYSEKFSSTERILQHLLRGLFKNSSLASSYIGCTLTSLRPMKEGEATGVDVVCAHYKGFTSPVLDPVKVYWELSNQTYGITRLGPYTLDRDSLFLNGYNDKEISSISSSSAESKGKIMTTAGEPETIMTTTSSPAVRTHSVLATTASTTASDIDLEKITVPASSALPETMVAPAAWSGVEMSPSETTLIAEISTPPGAGTGGGSPIGVPSHPATPDTTASTTAFRWTNVPPAGSTSTSATSLSSVSREDPKPMTSLDTSASETTAMATAMEGPALTESTATMDISRGAEAVVLSTSDLPTSSAVPLIPTDKVSTQTTMTTIADTAPSLTPSPSSSTAASGRPRRERFTMNFTINNMLYTEDMEHPYSEKFSSTERILQHLLRGLFKNSSLASSYIGCTLTSLRPMKEGEATGVDVVCTHYKGFTSPVLDPVKVYWELSNQTYGITRLGPYTLDRDSLFLNGYNDKEISSISSSSAESKGKIMTTAGEPETIMTTTSSPAVRTHSVLATTAPTTASDIDLEKITVPASSALPETMVAPAAWSGVEMSPSETTLIAEISTPPGAGTGGGSPIGVPSHPATPDTTASTTAFRWTNVPPAGSTSTSATSLSSVSREDPKPMTSLDTSASETTAMATAREGPALTESTATMDISRGAEAVVLSTSDLPTSSAAPLIPTDKVSTQTTMTTIADTAPSLTPSPSSSTAASGRPRRERFTMNFTINNMLYTEDMEHPYSEKFSSTERILQHLLRGLFKNSSLASSYIGCTLTSLRPMKEGEATGVDVVCTHYKGFTSPVLDPVKVYWELSNQTYGITRLGPYTLDRDSLFLNGYNDKEISSISSSSAESKGKIMTTAGEPETIMTTTSSPAVRTHSVLATTAPTTASDIDLEKITVPASSALPETMVAPAAWSGVEMSPSETTLIAEISTPPGAGTGGGSPIGVPSHPATPDTTASTTAFRWTNVPPAGSTSTSATSLSSVSREDPKPMTSLDTSASETTAMATAREGPALTESTAMMDISRGAEAVVLSTSDLPTSSAAPLIPTDKVSTQTTMTTIADTAPSLTPSPSSSTAASGRPRRERFTMNFTINNMLYTEDMEHPYSEKFSSTERILQHLLRGLFKNSSLASSYIGCTLTSLRPMKEGEATGVDVVCTHYKGFTSPVLDPVKVYWELSNQTYGITRLGPYTLDRDSLFLNGYNDKEISSISSSSAESKGKIMTTAGEPETIMTTTSSPAVRTHSVLATTASTTASDIDLEKITVPASSALPETMVAPAAWSGVEMSPSETMFIAEISTPPGAGTGGGSPIGVPSHPATPDTTASTTAFPWTNVPPAGSTSTSATSLSSVSRKDPKPMTSLDTSASETTAMATAREEPALTESTATMDIRRGAEAVVLSTSDLPTSSAVPLIPTDKVSTQTTMTTIADTATESSYLKVFTLNFTITNLFYTTDMGQKGSSKFNSTEDVLQYLINSLFRKNSFGSHYFGCRLTLLRSMKNRTATGVDVICAYQEDSSILVLDREKIYWELSEQTHGITRLGPYILDKESLYVDGYNHQMPNPSKNTWGPSLEGFNLNFTITNLFYTEDMEQRDSIIFKTTEKILQNMLGPLFENSSLGSSYSSCKLILLRPVKNLTATTVDTICLYQRDSTGPFLDRERVYWEFSNQTGGITRLGPYTLDRDSLYLNGYNHHLQSSTSTPLQTTIPSRTSSDPSLPPSSSGYNHHLQSSTSTPLQTTIPSRTSSDPSLPPSSSGYNHHLQSSTSTPLQTTIPSRTSSDPSLPPSSSASGSFSLKSFTLNFTITDLLYTEDMGRPGSQKFKATERVLQRLLSPLLENSSLGSDYSGCRLTMLRPVQNGTATKFLCGHWKTPTTPSLDRKKIYWELSNQTQGITRLGAYTLDNKSLYLNGYNYQKDLSSSTSTGGPNFESFTLKFTITNMRYTAEMGERGSSIFMSTERMLQSLLSSLFEKSTLGSQDFTCKLTLLRPMKKGRATRVHFTCIHQRDPASPVLNREKIYWELSYLTWSITRLGPYTLEKDSLYVNGYNHLDLTPTKMPSSLSFQSFTTIPEVLYTEDMHLSGSGKFNSTKRTLQRPMKNGSETGVCGTHRRNPRSSDGDQEKVYWELSNETKHITKQHFSSLERDSLLNAEDHNRIPSLFRYPHATFTSSC
ncbi:mucin-16-like isoform X2 [Monodelphis domestica]|uniref:mucin-16-like isoform X2 n=1 Tax=Monodelphis domestica TaxID=13616 RepID=UPI0024E252E8|nr:mucin-16-like isoform X2 [Monodelphis domestica]